MDHLCLFTFRTNFLYPLPFFCLLNGHSLSLSLHSSQYLLFSCCSLAPSLISVSLSRFKLIDFFANLSVCPLCLSPCSSCPPLCLSTCLPSSLCTSLFCLHLPAFSIFIQLFVRLHREWLSVSERQSAFIYTHTHTLSHPLYYSLIWISQLRDAAAPTWCKIGRSFKSHEMWYTF